MNSVLALSLLGLLTAGMLIQSLVMQRRQIRRRLRQSLEAFGRAIELRFPCREGATERIVRLSVATSKRMGLSARHCSDIEMAALLRDIGLCAVPYRQINQVPIDRWDEEQQRRFADHPEVAAAMIELVPSLSRLAPLVRNQAACFDGSSGPQNPCGIDLPIGSRILKVVGDYVESERRMGAHLAADHIRSQSGRAYDPEIVETFLAMLRLQRGGDRARALVA